MSSPAASTPSELDQIHNRIVQSAWLLGEAHNTLKALISAGSLDKEQLEKMRELMTIHKQYWGRFDALFEVDTELETKYDDDPSEASPSPSPSTSSHTLGKRGRSSSLEGADDYGDTESSPSEIQRKRARFSGPGENLDEEDHTFYSRGSAADNSNEERGGIPEDEKKTFTVQGPSHTNLKDNGEEDDEEDANAEDDDKRPPRPSAGTTMTLHP